MAINYGLLTTEEREYVTGDKSLSDLKQPRNKKNEIKRQIAAADRDIQLLMEWPEWNEDDWLDIARDFTGNNSLPPFMPEDNIQQQTDVAKAQLSKVAGGSSELVEILEEILEKRENSGNEVEQEEYSEAFVRGLVNVYIDSLTANGVEEVEAVLEAFFKYFWADKEEAKQIMRDEIST